MALPLILGLLGSTLGTTGALGTAIGAIGGGALGSGIGRFLETGDLEEGLKTGATSLIGGKALGAVLGGMGGQAATEGAKAVPTFGQAIAQDPTKTFGSTLMQAAQNPITLGQSTLAQATVPPPMPKKPDPVEFENRQAGIPRNVDRRPPPDYRPGYDGEFDYGITPNFGVGLMSEDDPLYMSYGGLVSGSRGQMVEQARPMGRVLQSSFMPAFMMRSGLRDLGNDIRSRVGDRTEEDVEKFVGDVDNMAQERFDVNLSEPNPRFKGAFSGKGQIQRRATTEDPRAMMLKEGGLMSMREGGELKPIPEGNKGLPNLPKDVRNKMGFMQEGGVAEIMAPNVEDSKELQTIIIRAARALQGATENPEKDIQVFVEKFGMQALNDLRQRVASGELSFGRDGGIRGMISGEGDGMSDSIEAEIVESAGDPSGSGRPLQVANNEYVVAADVVSDIGNGSSEAGAAKLDRLMKDVRLARHGTTEQPDEKDMMGVMKKAIS
tara:strand:- start:420 stop:1901 length:1482 start_codon:yes stop_codon:yes gene_type:complete